MNWCLLLIGDGRDEYHDRCMASVEEKLPTPGHLVKIDDREHELGFAGAIAKGWREVIETRAEYVFHVEADFLFTETVDLDGMASVLKRKPHLAQMALMRQPWNEEEKAAGGIAQAHPEDFEQITEHGIVWTEHRKYWTTNPSLYSTNWCKQGWPQVEHSEGVFTHRLLEDKRLKFAYWGAKLDPPRVIHIGEERQGVGY